MKRLNVYVDGFNLYFGMVEAGFDTLKWLDVHTLADTLKENGKHALQQVKYFTSRISSNPSKQKRQTTYLEALETTPVAIIYGKFQTNNISCNNCSDTWTDYKEKMTDVNIATQMIVDAFQDHFDVAMLISGDSDLVPPIRAIRNQFPQKEIIVAFPPMRSTNELKLAASKSFTIGRAKLAASQLPATVTSRSGFELRRPGEWT